MRELVLTAVPARDDGKYRKQPHLSNEADLGVPPAAEGPYLLGPRHPVTHSNPPRVDHRARVSESKVKAQSKSEGENDDSGSVTCGGGALLVFCIYFPKSGLCIFIVQ